MQWWTAVEKASWGLSGLVIFCVIYVAVFLTPEIPNMTWINFFPHTPFHGWYFFIIPSHSSSFLVHSFPCKLPRPSLANWLTCTAISKWRLVCGSWVKTELVKIPNGTMMIAHSREQEQPWWFPLSLDSWEWFWWLSIGFCLNSVLLGRSLSVSCFSWQPCPGVAPLRFTDWIFATWWVAPILARTMVESWQC